MRAGRGMAVRGEGCRIGRRWCFLCCLGDVGLRSADVVQGNGKAGGARTAWSGALLSGLSGMGHMG